MLFVPELRQLKKCMLREAGKNNLKRQMTLLPLLNTPPPTSPQPNTPQNALIRYWAYFGYDAMPQISAVCNCIFTARVRSTREGNVLTRVCPSESIHLSVHRGGVPISHNALQHFPECHEAGGGVPRSGYPPQNRGGTEVRVPPPGGGTEVRVPPRGGTEVRVPPPGGGTRVGQQKEYSLHGGRYASCVHAGGLSCYDDITTGIFDADDFCPENRNRRSTPAEEMKEMVVMSKFDIVAAVVVTIVIRRLMKLGVNCLLSHS